MPMCPMPQYPHSRREYQLGVSVQEAKGVGAQDARYPALSVLYTQHSLQDAKLASCEEKGKAS
jgi:hypothetical protein